MIGRPQITEAARYTDAELSELNGDFAQFLLDLDIEMEALFHVAGQRSARAAMTLDERDPTKLKPGEPFNLSPAAQKLLPLLTGVWTDGFIAGFKLNPRTPEEA